MNDLSAGELGTKSVNDGPVANLIRQQVSEEEWNTLVDEINQIAANPVPGRLARVFATIPRKIKTADTVVSRGEVRDIGPNDMPLVVKNWSLARLIRVWVLMHIPPMDSASYQKLIEPLFIYGEMEELVALYAALPVYHYPEAWQQRCAEGVRSNIGSVRQAVLIENHYPSRYLDEGSWNQLILKAFFTDEHILDIIGLSERNNETLARTLVDYAYERAAAFREINPMLWVLVAPYIDERAFALMSQRITVSGNEEERKAIAYACSQSGYPDAIEYVETNTEIKELLDVAGTPWAHLGDASKK